MYKIDNKIFEEIKEKFGSVASWAVWEKPNNNDLVSNMAADDVLNLDKNPAILNELRNDVIMVGLNVSVDLTDFTPFQNFHGGKDAKAHHNTVRNASKIRYAFQNTPYYGAYMTDIIKNCTEADSRKVETTKEEFEHHFEVFREELKILDAKQPLIIAFGGDVYVHLKKYLNKDEYSKLINIYHYSYYGNGCASHEGYRGKVLSQIENGL